ncbi:MAG TPA: hypothetical protein VEX68_09340 [Bryobacteraceae bacterium]|nr:hypothetical protein [Bryobacteraceae bacterium]
MQIFHNTRDDRIVVLVAFITALSTSAFPAEIMQPAQQNALVRKYCAVCHTDAAKNGGLSLENYDAAQPNRALAAMLLSKLRNGAMGAAGLGIPDSATRDAWTSATAAQAERAQDWTIIRSHAAGSKAPIFTASIIREVLPRKKDKTQEKDNDDPPVYRLTLTCNVATHNGEMQLTWSPEPQTDRTFLVSVDDDAGIPHKLEGREKKMGNGMTASTGLAASLLNAPLAKETLAVAGLFPGETVTFPLGDLNPADRRELAICFGASPGK